MSINLIDILKKCSFFSSLPQEAYLELIPFTEYITLKKKEILFSRGDLSTHIYIVGKGKLYSYLSTPFQEEKILGQLVTGDIFGELGAFSGEPRSLTVKAKTDTLLVKITAEGFKSFCNKYPTIILEIIKPIIIRSQQTIQNIADSEPKYWSVIIAANKNIPLDKFKNKLNYFIQLDTNVSVLHDKNSDILKLQLAIKQYEQSKKNIIILLSSLESEFALLSLKNISALYVLANYEDKNCIDSKIIAFTKRKMLTTPSINLSLIVLHNVPIDLPNQTHRWFVQANFLLCHHIRIEEEKDYKRLIRFLIGKPTGLVLGGGGARGWFHLGVIKLLQEQNIAIDIIGGVSAGAIIGACVAMDINYEKIKKKSENISHNYYQLTGLRNLTWPLISLFNPSKLINTLNTEFDKFCIEDLWIPFYCITSNLSLYQEEKHLKGLLAPLIYASCALPGVLPPHLINNNIHYDGGLLNNLPVNVMKNMIGKNGKIIASWLSSYGEDNTPYYFEAKPHPLKLMLIQLGWKKNLYKYPPFFETFINSLTLGASLKAKDNALLADYLISPDLKNYSIYKLSPSQEDELINKGYHEAKFLLKYFL